MLLRICVASLFAFVQAGATDSPEAAVSRLIETDRTFSSVGSGKPPADAISAMFADGVMLSAPGGEFVQGRANALAALKAKAKNLSGSVKWTPIRGGISADGTHGFTFGYMTLTKDDGPQAPLKYLSYWIKGEDGAWRVAAYRRRPRPEGVVSTDVMQPSLPEKMVPPTKDPEVIRKYAESLAAAEKQFSDEAQKIGLGAAFVKYGRNDAVNMGGPNEPAFVFGPDAIGKAVGEGTPTDRSEVEWSADRVLVASSGDLGITFGVIRFHQPRERQPSAVPFFTIWRRDNPSQPWRYIVE